MSKYYRLEELERFAQVIVAPAKRQQLSAFAEAEREDGRINEVPFDNIERGCKAVQHLLENAADHTYDQWLPLAQILSRTRDGRRLFHKISAAYPDYDAAEADRKFDEARFNMAPATCSRLEEVTGGSACMSCAFRGSINSPMALPHVPGDMVEMMSDYVAVVSPPLFAHVESGRRYTEKAFEQKYSYLAEKGRVTVAFLKSKSAGRVDEIAYLPGKPTGILIQDDKKVLNTWRDTGIAPKDGEFGTIFQHFCNLFPDGGERDHVIDYLAHLVQKPGVKIKHVLLTIGGQGIGKSAIGLLVKRLVGADNTREVGPSEAEGRFKARWGNQQVFIFEELMAVDRLKFYNDLKEWITQESVTVEEKHIQAYEAATPRGFLAFSNEQIPTRIAPDDRRFYVLRSEMTQQSPDYYERLFDAINGAEAAAFKHHLMNRDISGFRPDARPPMTAAKAELIADTRAPIETRIEQVIESEQGLFAKDLVTLEAVRSAAREDFGDRKPSVQAVTAAMRSLGHKALPNQVRLDDGTRPRLWAIRNHEKWLQAEPSDIREYMNRK